jgi:multicomponent Na+:H+ antiporter subunit E
MNKINDTANEKSEIKSIGNRNEVRCFFDLFIILFVTWIVLTSSFNWQELVTGFIISVGLSVFLSRTYIKLGLPAITLKRIWYFMVYVVVLFVEVVMANFDVAYRIIHPKLPIKPGIVVIKTELKQDLAKMMLANSITLTPGTFTLDIVGDRLLIHWISVRSDDIERASEMIGYKFEKYLKVIFS